VTNHEEQSAPPGLHHQTKLQLSLHNWLVIPQVGEQNSRHIYLFRKLVHVYPKVQDKIRILFLQIYNP